MTNIKELLKLKGNNKPVYLDNNPLNSYRRGYEGDYKCLFSEVKSMLREKNDDSMDCKIITTRSLNILKIRNI